MRHLFAGGCWLRCRRPGLARSWGSCGPGSTRVAARPDGDRRRPEAAGSSMMRSSFISPIVPSRAPLSTASPAAIAPRRLRGYKRPFCARGVETMPVIEDIRTFHDELTGWRRDIHAHPELGFEEQRTSDLVAEKLAGFGIEVHRGMGKTGVVSRPRRGSAVARLW